MRLLLPCALLFLGCSDHFSSSYDPDAAVEDATPPFFQGLGIGGECSEKTDCRDGLDCQDGACAPTGDKPEDARCLLTAECGEGLTCGWAGFCVPAGEAVAREGCSSSADCARGFYCELSGGLAGQCAAVAADGKDLDEPCEETKDCLSGLVCSPGRKVCTPGSVLLNPDVFRGVACDTDEEAEMPFGVRMRLPREDRPVRFYGFPFPTDVRMQDGKVDLSEHPTPGDALIGKDPPARVLGAINGHLSGFSVNPAVYLRFTRPVDLETLEMRFLNLDADPVADVPHERVFVPERNKYICHNYLYVHPRW